MKRFGGWASVSFGLAAVLFIAAGWVALGGVSPIGTPRSVLLREARDRVADQISGLFAQQAMLGRLISVVPVERRVALIDEICRDNPRLWNIVLSDPPGRITARCRPVGTGIPTLGELLVPFGSKPAAVAASGAQLGRSADLARTPLLLGVTSAVGGEMPAMVTILTRLRDLPGAGASMGRSWLLTDDGVLLADRVVEPEVAALLTPVPPAASDTDRTIRVPMEDGEHRFMLRRLGGWPASLVMNAGLQPRPQLFNNTAQAMLLGLSGVLLVLLGLSWRGTGDRQAEPRTVPVDPVQPAAPSPPVQRLASGLAHEMNNLLTMVSLDAELVGALHADDAELASLSRSMLAAAGQGAALTQLLLAYAQRLALQPRLVDLALLLREHAGLLRERLRPDQTLSFVDCERECLVRVDPQALLGCLGALLRNAVEASDPRGEIHVEIVRMMESGRTMAAVVVDDAGPGMHAWVMAQAMQPGFSTKPEGRHLGMGLAACDGFARQSGGALRLASEPGLGVRASLVLPAEPETAGRGVDAPRQAAVPVDIPANGRVMSVLLVDDSDTVRSSVARHLRLEGYYVQEAGCVEQALSLLGRGADVLVTDVVLDEGEDGWMLGAKARAIDPSLPLVFMSGFMTVRLPDLLASDDLASFVRKPVGGAELVAVIAGLLALRQTRRSEAALRA